VFDNAQKNYSYLEVRAFISNFVVWSLDKESSGAILRTTVPDFVEAKTSRIILLPPPVGRTRRWGWPCFFLKRVARMSACHGCGSWPKVSCMETVASW
jgi:hypothetical protein